MRWLTPLLASFALVALASTPGQARDFEYSTTIKAPGVKIATLVVTAGDKMTSEKKRWGPDDVAWLKKDLTKKIWRTLEAKGLKAQTGARLEVTLVDATPNRPTIQAMTGRLALDFRSFGIGGATVDARLVSADGRELGRMHYRWTNPQLISSTSGSTVWYDASRAFDRFARHLAKALKTPASS